MIKQIRIRLSPEEAASHDIIKQKTSAAAGLNQGEIREIKILSRSIDSRGKTPLVEIKLEAYTGSDTIEQAGAKPQYKKTDENKRVIIAGSGPAGMFAALKLVELGIRPIIIERGKPVRERRFDLKKLNLEQTVDPDSNYCFGEGGAGTFSDGKLYTRSKKRGSVYEVLKQLVWHGANPEIITDARPHIGTNKLPDIVQNIRKTITEAGGEYHFGQRLTDIIIENGTVKGIKTHNGDAFYAGALILATGHSAHDIYEMLHGKGITLQQKGLAVGLRVEHSQELIDKIQYKGYKSEFLPPASYRLVEQVGGRGVYSFCMCPGGYIVPSATAGEQVVVNGMSPSSRGGKFANSGIVVSVGSSDLPEFEKYGPLAMLRFRQQIEKNAWLACGKSQRSPAARMTDFCTGKISSSLKESSYVPGTVPADLHEILGSFIASRLAEGLKVFGRKMHGFYSEDAMLLGVESRTSSPLRIIRDENTLQHPEVRGLFPCGEGAGYAGGIVSAAIDGQNTAEASAFFLTKA